MICIVQGLCRGQEHFGLAKGPPQEGGSELELTACGAKFAPLLRRGPSGEMFVWLLS